MVRRKTPVPEPRNVDKETIYVVSISTLEKNKITNAIIFSTGTRKVQFYTYVLKHDSTKLQVAIKFKSIKQSLPNDLEPLDLDFKILQYIPLTTRV